MISILFIYQSSAAAKKPFEEDENFGS